MPVLDHLDVVYRVCLKYTNRAYSFSIPSVNQSRLSRCEKWLIMCRFETDLLEYPDKVVCTLSNGLVYIAVENRVPAVKLKTTVV